MKFSLCTVLDSAVPSDERKGSAYPESHSLFPLAARLSLAAGKRKSCHGKPQAFRTSRGSAAADRALRYPGPQHQSGSVGWLICSSIVLLLLTMVAVAQTRVTIDHNDNITASGEFKFQRVPAPSRHDAAAKALLKIVDAEADGNSADISVLIDGLLPDGEDQSRRNFFLNAGSGGGRVRMDLGSVMEISQVNSYSWHSGTRGPQVYRL